MRSDAELKALPHLDYTTFTQETKDGITPEMRTMLAEYFSIFAPLTCLPEDAPKDAKPPEQTCIGCGYKLTGLFAGLLGPGGFTWGLAHGEGHCCYCGWPGRAHHYIKDKEGADMISLHNFVLQYHPEHVNLERVRAIFHKKEVESGRLCDEPGCDCGGGR
jgi:hypothetical protein